MKNVLIAQHPVWELLPYGRSSDLKENSIDLHMADTLHFEKFLFTSLCEFTNIFIRIVFKSTYSRVSYQSHSIFLTRKFFESTHNVISQPNQINICFIVLNVTVRQIEA